MWLYQIFVALSSRQTSLIFLLGFCDGLTINLLIFGAAHVFLAVAAVIEVVHVYKVVLDIYNIVLCVLVLGALCIGTLDVVYVWKGRVVLDVLVQELRVPCSVIDFVVVYNKDAPVLLLFYGLV